ncbi:Nucleotidyl transferase [Gracilaria domingensis]|nr:Nucleotidyl transferase [Gracilaria domingensis]
MSTGINVIIPMAGLGTRYSKAGYSVPKPLVNILACPMIFWLLRNVGIRTEDTIYVAVRQELQVKYRIGDVLAREFPKFRFRFVALREQTQTRGAAETLCFVLACMDTEELSRPTISLDCDTIYFEDVLDYFRMLPPGFGMCACFEDYGRAPIYSYIRVDLDNNNEITAIAEKRKISNLANTGAYGFPSGRLLNHFLGRLLQKPVPAVGEYYISSVIQDMIRDGIKFVPRRVCIFQCVGTPRQLLEFLEIAKNSIAVLSMLSIPKKVLIFNIKSLPAVVKQSTFTTSQLKDYIPEDAWNIMCGLQTIGFTIGLSMENGNCPSMTSDNGMRFVGCTQRALAQKEGRFFLLDETLSKAVGY